MVITSFWRFTLSCVGLLNPTCCSSAGVGKNLPLKKYHHRLWVWHWCLQETNITLCVSSTYKEFFWWKFSKFLNKSRNAFYYFEYLLFATRPRFIINGQVCIHLLVYFSCKLTGIMNFYSSIRSYSIASSHCQGSRVHMGPSCRTVALRKNFCWQTGELQCNP